MSDAVTASVIEVGEIPLEGRTVTLGAVIKFSSVDDLRRAIAGTATVRLALSPAETPEDAV